MTLNEIKQIFRRRRVEKVKLGGFDIDGVLRGKYISIEKFFSAVESSLGFCDVIFGWDSSDALYDNVRLTGWHTGYPDAQARIAGAALLYVVMIYLVLPWANPLMCPLTPRGPFFIGHLIYGLIFGLVAYPLARRGTAA